MVVTSLLMKLSHAEAEVVDAVAAAVDTAVVVDMVAMADVMVAAEVVMEVGVITDMVTVMVMVDPATQEVAVHQKEAGGISGFNCLKCVLL